MRLLDLSYNALTTLPDDVFEGLTALTDLDLDSNRLTTLSDDVFDGLTALTGLTLRDNALTTLSDDVFDGLIALTGLDLAGNDLPTLPDDVFEGLPARTTLDLTDNPGAPFAPEAVALPDDGTVPLTGGMVTLDGSGSDGGPWGTNVTYGWALTEPVSGVTVTFDDATSATTEVTIPEVAAGTELTFTLTVTPRGGTDGIAPATATATVRSPASDDAKLSALTVNDGTSDLTLAPAFASGMFVYAADVAGAVDEVTLSATVNQAGASVRAVTLNGTAIADSDFTDGITVSGLLVGGNEIVVTVTAQDTSTTRTYTVTVTRSANIAPTASASSVTTNEDTEYTFAAADFNFDDTDSGDTLVSVRIVTLPASDKGTLTLNGANVSANDSVTTAQLRDGNLKYIPPANAHGGAYTSFTFRVHDGTDESAAAYTMTVSVTAMNDPATGAPAISGAAQVSQTLTAATTGIADVDGLTSPSYGYQWIRVDADGTSNPTEITGATLATYTPVRADVGNKLRVKVSFTDDDSNDEELTSDAYPASGTVEAAPNAAASFTSPATFNAAENQTAVGTVAASDGDPGDSVTGYALQGGADRSRFTIVAATGVLTFASAPNFEAAADADTDNDYVVVVRATSGTGAREKTADQTITVTVTDEAGEAPGAPATPSVSTASATSLNVSWTAPSNAGPPITDYDYRYRVKTPPGSWTEVTTTPITAFRATIAGLAENTEYEVQVRATNAEGTGDWSDPPGRGATDANAAPSFTSPATVDAAENQTAVGTVAASDGDPGDSVTGYALQRGADRSRFTIVASTGVLTFTSAPNFEAAADADTDNDYVVVVRATSGTGAREKTADQTITVTVTDEGGEAPGAPATPSVSTASATSLNVSWTAPSNAGPAITDYDYRYRVKVPPGSWTEVTTTPITAFRATIAGLAENTEYEVQVRATNAEGTGDWSDPPGRGATDANAAPSFTSPATYDAAENQLAVGTVAASDGDPGDSVTGYALQGGADRSRFTIVASTGVLTFTSAPNFEAAADADTDNDYVVVVRATSGTGAREKTADQTITVTVTDEAGEAPGAPATPSVSTASATSLNVSWTAPSNAGPAITSYDLQYRIGDSGDFTAGPQDVAGTSAPIAGLAENTEYEVQVRATNAEGTGDWSDPPGSGSTDANAAPSFTSPATVDAAENQLAVGTVAASDGDPGDSVTGYALQSGADRSRFTIVAATGVLAFTSAPNFEAPADADTNNDYVVVVRATSGTGAREKTADQTITVTVTDEGGEAPGAPATPSVSTASVTSLNVSWAAPSNAGPAITDYDYRYRVKTPPGPWTEVTTTPITALGATIAGLAENTEYEVQVRATNAEGTGDWSDPPGSGSTDANAAASFTSPATYDAAENQLAVGTVAASDDDSGDGVTGYTIQGGADQSTFSIVAATGVLTFTSAPNFEAPTDGGGNNDYEVVVRATSGTGAREKTADQPITVTVTNEAGEAPGVPITVTVSSASVTSVTVTWTAPSNEGPPITDYDYRYRVKTPPGPWTEVTTTPITALGAPIAGLAENTEYEVQVRATNAEGTGDWSDPPGRGATDANAAPSFTTPATVDAAENQTVVGTVAAADGDPGDSVTGYALQSGADRSRFTIVEATGVLTFASAPNFEAPADADTDNDYVVVVRATSGTGAREKTADQTITVTVTDEAGEAPGVPATPSVSTASATSLNVSWAAPSNAGPAITDYDYRYRVKTPPGPWTEVTTTPITALGATIAGLAENTEYEVQVRATNAEGTGDWSDPPGSGSTDANAAPSFTTPATFDAAENQLAVGTVAASDGDPGDSVTGYAIQGGADAARFTIVEASGVLTFTSAPNFEAPADADTNNDYVVVVRATSGTGGRLKTADQTITVTVTRAANAAPTASASSVTTNEDTAYTFAAADFNFTDTNTGDTLASVTVVTLPTEGSLTLDGPAVRVGQSVQAADIGKLVFTPAANGYGDDYASFTFRVHDGTDESASAYVMTVNVTAMNDPATGAPTISGTAQTGQTLAAVTTGIVDVDGLTSPTYGYQWIRVDADGTSNPIDIAGAASGTYTQVRADVGKKLRVKVSFTDDDGNDEELTSAPTATETVLDPTVGICGRTLQVRDALVALIPGVSHCADVTATHLAAITGTLRIARSGITALAARDFDGLTGVTGLAVSFNALTTLPDGVFDALTSLRHLYLQGNQLSTLPDGVFDELTSLTDLVLASNDLTTLRDDVFDGLTSLSELSISYNDLTTLPDDVFDGLTSLTDLALGGNPGAPFAPEAVALPDDGTVPAAGGTVTLDGSGSGGPWGTNVTYGWALTDPVSGVTVTFDDAASATTEVTIPALATDTELTFTLTVTGRGGTDGIAPATDTAIVTATASDDAKLSALTVNDGTNDLTLAPPFASGTFVYAADVATAVDEVTLSATVNHAGASVRAVTLNGTAVADSDFTDGITVSGLLVGGNEIIVTVTAQDTSSTRTYTVTVTRSANTAPTASASSVTTNEDTEYTFAAADFNFDDTDSGDTLVSVRIVTLPASDKGTLTLNGANVRANDSVTTAQLRDGNLKYIPPANAHGGAYASFTFRVHDGTDESAAAYTMTVNVTAMNDPATGAPAISGAAQVSQTLTAATTGIADVDGLTSPSYGYQWIRVDADGTSNPTDITGATLATYTLVLADVGKKLRVKVSFTDDDSNDEELTSAPTATVMVLDPTVGICGRTEQVRDALVALIPGVSHCADVTATDLAAITGTLSITRSGITALAARDFDGLTGVTGLAVSFNALTTLPDGVFDALTSLRHLYLQGNQLSTLPDGVFDELTSLTDLVLASNDLTTLRDDVFDGLTSLSELSISYNDLTTLPDDVFDGLTSLSELSISYNDLTTLPDDVFDGLTSLEELYLNENDLATLLPADVFDGLTALTTLALGGNPGAPFAPEAVALPDDGTVSAAEGTVTLDGSGSDGGPWGTNVTYGWALTDPASGVTVTFDDAASATPVVTIPALATDTELTFTLTVTGRGGTDGIAPATDTATVTAILDPTAGICGRTPQVRDALVAKISGVSHCAHVTATHLAAITGTLLLNSVGITALAAGDFDGLTGLSRLFLAFNALATLGEGVFDGLTSLSELYLENNQLTTLDDDVFEPLTALTGLYLQNNQLPTLPDGVFDGLTALTGLYLFNNALATLGEGVFDGLTSLRELSLIYNQLTTLDDDVFQPLTALTTLALRENPGAPFAPEAVALPDDGTVSNGGGTVTLDGSGSGGPWGTHVTYGWALTDPASGVTVTFDDAASATPVVTIPALATDTELTFTLTVTGRGGTDGIAPATDTATVTAILDGGICGRTLQVRDGLVAKISGVSHCADVTASHLAAITGDLRLNSVGITALAAGDFDGLTGLSRLFLAFNALATLGEGVFDGLTSLSELYLENNQLTTLDDDVFEPLTALTRLYLQNNQLPTLPDGVFDGLTALTGLYLFNNALATLGEGVFDGLTALMELSLIYNQLTTLDDDVFQPLTALTTLALRENPGAPFAPEAVALPDDGTVSAAGGTVTLDGSGSDGGPWGTNVTYGWALTEPVSGVTVTFDDAASATTEVTIPEVAAGTELTFTLTVTGRGGTDGIAPAPDTATVTVDPTVGICGRTEQVRDALVALIPGVSHCADVTATHLAAITGDLRLGSVGITALAVGDFDGLTGLSRLFLAFNALATLGEGVFDGLTSLSELYLQNNQLTTLDNDVFEPLTALTRLYLQNNQLTTLDDDVFEPLTALTGLYLFNNALATLGEGVFDGLTSLSELSLIYNQLTTLDDDAFEPLTALTTLALRENPGAPFAPEAVALPDDGTVSAAGGTVTLDGSGSDGGPWGTKVTYGWALTDPTSGVTVTFDDAASATPVVTIPALATDTELTFTLTVTGRGGTDGIAPATDTATVTVDPGICGRTLQVRNGLVALIPGVSHCAQVTATHLAAITGAFRLTNNSIDRLAAGDFDGLTSLSVLGLQGNNLTTLPDGVFDGLTSLTSLTLQSNRLTTLSDDVFEPLTSLSTLLLEGNRLTTLDAGMFAGLTGLTRLDLGSNALTTLSDDVFEPLTSLKVLSLDFNNLATLDAGVFDGLTALTDLGLASNQLTTLSDDVFEPLTALTALTLSGNPGAPFAPDAVALPDDGTVPAAGGMVTLDGSGSDGGPWGTNVTYGWALTEPASGVTVTFDDDTSATPEVTIPALTTDTELTFTLTVTGRGGTDGIAPAPDTATVTVAPGICGRTPQVRDALVALIPGVSHCADVTATHLAAITGTLSITRSGITALAARDFDGLTGVTGLAVSFNALTTLPDGVFDELTSLRHLYLQGNQLSTLPDGVFDELTSLTDLVLASNDLTTLRDDVFDGLTSLSELSISYNDLTTLPDDVFDGLTSLSKLSISYNDLTTLPDDVFDGLTSLTDLALGGNPGAPFAPEAVALPDAGTVSNGGGTVTLDGSGSDGGPWGTNVTYGWALTEPASGVTVTFDDDTSATPEVTIPALATDTELTFTLTVTGRGGTDGIAPATAPATVTVAPGICGRTLQVRDALVALIPGVSHCADVTATHLAAITGTLSITRSGITALAARDFDGLTGLTQLLLSSNRLATLPDGVFDELTALTRLRLGNNRLATLPDGVFDGLTSLTRLYLNDNALARLPAGVFDGLTALTVLTVASNDLTTLDDDVFDGPTSLTTLFLDENDLPTLPADVFEPLTALTDLDLRDNPGAPFAPEAVALPDDGTVPFTGGTVTLDGSGSDGGPWGTNVTYGWALTDPVSGVTVTFDDAASATPEVTIPALTAGTGLTFTLTVTGRGGTDGIVPATDTATVTATASDDAKLSALTVNDGTSDLTLAPAFASGTFVYAADVATAVDEVTLSATVNHAGAAVSAVTLNGTAVADSDFTDGITVSGLLAGGNDIVVTVTAEDTSTTRTYTVTVTANTAPTALDASVTTNEDTAYTFGAADFNFDDTDTGDALASVTVVTLPAEGALELDGTTVMTGQLVPAADIGKLVFTPVANGHGDAYARFTFRVHDGTDESASAYTMTVNVTAMNDPATGAPTISGTALVDEPLPAATTGIADVDGLTSPSYGYQWIRVDADGTSNPTDITGATLATYTLVLADVGKKLRVKVIFTDDDGNDEELTSAPTPTVIARQASGATVGIAAAFAPEGDPLTFTVTLAAAATGEVTVDYAISVGAGDTAAEADFTAGSGTLTFAVGEIGQTFTVSTLEDRIDESDETFTVILDNVSPAGAASLPADPTATGTIIDDDAAPVLVLSVDTDTIAEAGGTSTVMVSTAAGSTFPDEQTITLTGTGTATETGDYTISPKSLTLPAGVGSGASSVTATVTAVDDTLSEGDETVLIDAAFGTGNLAVGTRQTLTIIDDDRHATGAPVITGTAQVGMMLTASAGTIADADGLTSPSYGYQWIRVDGADETEIPGAISASYAPGPDDVGQTLKVRASFTDDAGFAEQRTSDAYPASGTVDAAPNAAPSFTSPATVDAAENQLAVGTVAAADGDAGDRVTGYALQSGADRSRFTIVASSGVLTFASAPNFEAAADADTNNDYVVVVRATSGTGGREKTADQTITVTVTDEAGEAPGAPATPSVSTASATSLNVSWTAPSNAGPAITDYDYRYRVKTPPGSWTEVTTTPITAFGAPIAGLAENTEYEVQVRATNAEGTGDWSDPPGRGATDANAAPSFTSPATVDAAENQLAVGTVAASDGNPGDSVTGYALQGVADASRFTIVPATGVLAFTSAPNFEAPADADTNNDYVVVVRATSGTGAREKTADQTITVTVTDEGGEAPGAPATPTVATASVSSVTVAWAAPSNAGPAITSYDLQYRIGDSGDFTAGPQDVAGTSAPIAGLAENTEYEVQVRATNAEGTGDWSDPPGRGATDANAAPSFTSPATVDAAENQLAVGTVAASDGDPGDRVTGYALQSGADQSQFSIVEATGVLTFRSAPNFEAAADADTNNEYVVVVRASSGTGAREKTADQTITVTVTDEAGEAPGAPATPSVSTASATSLNVSWTAPSNAGPAITSYDLQYRIGDSGDFTAGPQDVAGTSATIAGLAENTEYEVQVRATNAEGTGDWSDPPGRGATDANAAPSFTSPATVDAAENQLAVGTVAASDGNPGDSVTGYALQSGADAARFTIVAASGVLTFASAPNFEAATDADTNNDYVVVVRATSGTGAREKTADQTITVTVTDEAGEAPGAPATPSVSSASVTSLNVSWTAPSNAGPPITDYDYRYRVKTPPGLWTEVTTTPITAFRATIAGLAENTEYEVQVRATNAEGTGDWSDPPGRGATDANAAPSFTSPATVDAAENQLAVGTVAAADGDAGDRVTGYALQSGADRSRFTIVASTGELTFTSAPNFEAPADADTDNDYVVVVRATSGTGVREKIADQTITVTVTDEAGEAPGAPATPSVSTASATSLNVSWTAPSNAGPPITDYDYRYRVKVPPGSWTEVTTTPITAFRAPIAGLAENTEYEVQVRATNAEGTGDWSDPPGRGATDANAAPSFTSPATVDAAENQLAVGTVAAADGDPGDSVTGYALQSGADRSRFTIVASTGVLTFTSAPNFEAAADADTNNDYVVVVRATSGTGAREKTADQTITVTVTDEAGEAPGAPATPSVSTASATSLNVSWTAPSNAGPAITDYDYRYRVKVPPGSWTEVTTTPITGTSATIAGLAENTEYEVQVRATNAEGTGDWSDPPGRGATDANAAPSFTSPATVDAVENQTAVGTVAAADGDPGDSVTGYALQGGADRSRFTIVASTGELTFTSAPNFEAPADADTDNDYVVVVRATSGTGVREKTADQTITVTVTDEAGEAPGAPATPSVSTASATSLNVSWTAPPNAGPPITDYDYRYRVKVPPGSWTEVTTTPITAFRATIAGLAENTEYEVQVRATNAEGTGDWSDPPGRGATDANAAPSFTSPATYDAAENQLAVGTVAAADGDAGDSVTGYAIQGGADRSRFTIVASTGVLTFTSAPNFEAAADADTDNDYVVVVRATSGTGGREKTADQTITVTVTDEAGEAPGAPATPSVSTASATSLNVSWTAPSNAGPAITDYDYRYRVKTPPGSWTEVTTTPITAFGAPIAGLAENTEYEVQVRATNAEGTGDWSDPPGRGATDANAAPSFTSSATVDAAENQLAVGTVAAADGDPGDRVTGYALQGGADRSRFTIVAATGVLTFASAPNFEAAADADANNEYVVVVRASSGTGAREKTADQTITVTVTDEGGEAPGVPATPTVSSASATSLNVSWTAPSNARKRSDSLPRPTTPSAWPGRPAPRRPRPSPSP